MYKNEVPAVVDELVQEDINAAIDLAENKFPGYDITIDWIDYTGVPGAGDFYTDVHMNCVTDAGQAYSWLMNLYYEYVEYDGAVFSEADVEDIAEEIIHEISIRNNRFNKIGRGMYQRR